MSLNRKLYKGEDLAMRFEQFGGRIVRLCEELPSTRPGKHVQDQLLRCGTSVGAQYSEAQGAQSRRDFVHKLSIALKEMRESRYWLGVLAHADYLNGMLSVSGLSDEANELVAILQASQSTARKGVQS